MTEQSLYERIGGVNAISMVVDRFSDEVVKNPKLNVNPALKKWNQSGKLPGLKFMRTLWICQAAGGPFQYTGKDMHEAHKDLHITSEEFDEVGAEIARALDDFNVPEREKQEVLAAVQIGTLLGELSAALIGAGLLSVMLFSLLALMLLGDREQSEKERSTSVARSPNEHTSKEATNLTDVSFVPRPSSSLAMPPCGPVLPSWLF